MLRSKWSISSLILVGVVSVLVILGGWVNYALKNPVTLYEVSLGDEVIGTVLSEEEFENFINEKQELIKEKYGVSKVYMPDMVHVQKIITYDRNYDSNEKVYQEIVSRDNFTIQGCIITISDVDDEAYQDQKIYVLEKSIFDDAMALMVKAFVGEESYLNYIEDTQAEIVDTGSLIDGISIRQDVTYHQGYISTDEMIFTNASDLSKYLLYGVTSDLSTYTVLEGDTISDVAEANSLNVQEFLIANPSFTSENNLLYAGQEVVVGLVDPVLDIEVVVHAVEDEVAQFNTEIQYDETQLQIYEEVLQEGENGLNRVTKKYQYLNGQLVDTQNISTSVLQPSVSKIVVKGSRVAPHIAELSYWAWPTNKPYTITTYFGYRWGEMHYAIDIAGTGYGSPIYAANNGTVVKVGTGCVAGNSSCNGGRGNYIIINHNIGGYYTTYLHLKSILVYEGLTVERGQKIATMGNTGFVVPAPTSSSPYSGTHLDFGVFIGYPWSGGTGIDPLRLY